MTCKVSGRDHGSNRARHSPPTSSSFKIGSLIVAQDLAFGSKQIAPTLLEMAHQRIAVLERLIQSSIETVLASHSSSHPKGNPSPCAKTIAHDT